MNEENNNYNSFDDDKTIRYCLIALIIIVTIIFITIISMGGIPDSSISEELPNTISTANTTKTTKRNIYDNIIENNSNNTSTPNALHSNIENIASTNSTSNNIADSILNQLSNPYNIDPKTNLYITEDRITMNIDTPYQGQMYYTFNENNLLQGIFIEIFFRTESEKNEFVREFKNSDYAQFVRTNRNTVIVEFPISDAMKKVEKTELEKRLSLEFNLQYQN